MSGTQTPINLRSHASMPTGEGEPLEVLAVFDIAAIQRDEKETNK